MMPLKTDDYFYYFAYGSCMCPVDLKRSLGESTHAYVVGAATLKDYRLRFNYYSPTRRCGALGILPASDSEIQGVLYQLPWRLSKHLDQREGVPQGRYRRQQVSVESANKRYRKVRTYMVVQETPTEIAPNDWYFEVVMRGAITCKLSEEYCWKLFNYMRKLQQAYALP